MLKSIREMVGWGILAAAIVFTQGAAAPQARGNEIVLTVTPSQSIQPYISSFQGLNLRLILTEGVYTEALLVAHRTTPLTIEAAPGAHVVLRAPHGQRALLILDSPTTVTLRGIEFSGNTVNSQSNYNAYGGAVRASNVQKVRFVDCVFKDNLARLTTADDTSAVEGGACIFYNSTVELDGCVFEGNAVEVETWSATTTLRAAYGGAVAGYQSTLRITDTKFISNKALIDAPAGVGNADALAHGGALWALSCDVVIDRCVFVGNEAVARAESGSQVKRHAAGGAAFLDDHIAPAPAPRIYSSLFARNACEGLTSARGGAIFASLSQPLMALNCTLVENESAHAGAAVYSAIGGAQFGNTIFAWNTTQTGLSEIGGVGFASLGHNLFTSVDAALIPGVSTSDLIGSDPNFVDRDAGDFRPAPGSIAIDRGDTDLVVDARLAWDLDGAPRAVDHPDAPNVGPWMILPSGHAAAVDIGAYELQPEPLEPPCPGDLNGDGRVNAQDLAVLLGSWGMCQ